MSKKISELNETEELLDEDIVPVVNSNETKKTKFSTILTYIQTKLSTVFATISDIPTKTSDLQNDSGFGTYTKPSGGIPKTDLENAVQTSLGKADTALQSHQDISGKEDKSNKVNSISSSSTDTQYPSAKAVYNNSLEAYSTTEQRIGTWYDGKPLYEITIVDTTPNVTTDGTAVTKKIGSLNNIDTEFISASFSYNDINVWTLPYINGTGRQLKTLLNKNKTGGVFNGNVDYYISSDGTAYNNATVVSVLRYTKRTDTAS